MDVSKLLDIIKKGVEFAEQLSPVLSMIPGAGPIVAMAVKAAGAITDVVTNVQERVEEGQIVMNSDQSDELNGYIARLAAINDSLATEIDDS